jgi:hypothetical protein
LPQFARFLDESFRQNEWVYVSVTKRLDQPHMRGYDTAKTPVFRFPPEVVANYEAIKRLEAEQKKKRD